MLCPHAPGKFSGLLSGLLLLLVTTAPALAADCYTWTDQNGQVHITTAPPPPGATHAKGVSGSVSPKPARKSPATSTQPSRQSRTVQSATSTWSVSQRSIQSEHAWLQTQRSAWEREKQKSSFDLGISKRDKRVNEKMRVHRERCDKKIASYRKRIVELFRDPERYAIKYGLH